MLAYLAAASATYVPLSVFRYIQKIKRTVIVIHVSLEISRLQYPPKKSNISKAEYDKIKLFS